MNQIKLESGVYLTENEYIAHSPDFKFMAGGKDENGICTSYSFRDVDLSIFAKFINKNKLKRIVFQYGFDGHEGPFTIDLNKIDDYSSLESISFDLAKDAIFNIEDIRKTEFAKLRSLKITGKFPPSNIFLDGLVDCLDELEISFSVLSAKGGINFSKARTLRLLDAPAKGTSDVIGLHEKLLKLHFDSCSVKDTAGSENLSALKILIFAGCKNLEDLSNLMKSTSIQHLVVSECPRMKDWSFLAEMPQLKSLRITNSIDLNFVKKLGKLEFFHIEKIKKNEPIPSLKKTSPQFGEIVNANLAKLAELGVLD